MRFLAFSKIENDSEREVASVTKGHNEKIIGRAKEHSRGAISEDFPECGRGARKSVLTFKENISKAIK